MYEYEKINDTIRINKYTGQEAEVTVPESIEGMAVTAIGDYAFHNCRGIYKISLPKSIHYIGNHAFYDCRKLSCISFSDSLQEIYDGAFKNCDLLNRLELKLEDGTMRCLKSVLSELNQEFLIQIQMEAASTSQSGNQATDVTQFVVPKYLYNYIDNTEARSITQETHGTGVHYRECIGDLSVDFKKYDELFVVVKDIESLKTACNIALNRILYPYRLLEGHKEIYLTFLREELMNVMEFVLLENDMAMVEGLANQGLFTSENINQVIDLAHQKEQIECVSYLMKYKQERFASKKKTFDF